MYNSYYQQILRVNGIEGARAYQMAPNTTVALFDANEDIFYVKSSDAGGFSNIRAFTFKPMECVSPPTDFVTRKEFEELKELINGKQYISDTEQDEHKPNA